MKKEEIGKIVLESVASLVIGLIAESLMAKVKERKKEQDFESTMVGDLTVDELRTIIRDEA